VHGVAERRRDVLFEPQLAALGGRRAPGLLVELGGAIGVEPEAAHLAEATADLVVLGLGQAALVVADRERDLEQAVGEQAVVLGRRTAGVAAAGRDDRRARVERRPRVRRDGRVRWADAVEALERDHRGGRGRPEVPVDDQPAPAHRAQMPVELELEQLDVAAAGRIGQPGRLLGVAAVGPVAVVGVLGAGAQLGPLDVRGGRVGQNVAREQAPDRAVAGGLLERDHARRRGRASRL
jgi:hypothetical protein